jgi:flagellar biosynthesis protein FliQ
MYAGVIWFAASHDIKPAGLIRGLVIEIVAIIITIAAARPWIFASVVACAAQLWAALAGVWIHFTQRIGSRVIEIGALTRVKSIITDCPRFASEVAFRGSAGVIWFAQASHDIKPAGLIRGLVIEIVAIIITIAAARPWIFASGYAFRVNFTRSRSTNLIRYAQLVNLFPCTRHVVKQAEVT